jgi:RimJ/RimL family protein N-acetyltransferase
MHLATTRLEPPLTTARLVLRRIAEADIGDLLAEVNDLAVTRMLARVPHPYGRRDAEAFLASVKREAGRNLSLAIARGGRMIGGIGLAGVTTGSEFGYWLGRTHWGKGYATEAAEAFLRFVFAEFDLKAVHSGVFIDNPASLRVQEKLGFERAGMRQIDCLARGRKVDHIDTILTRARFREMRP